MASPVVHFEVTGEDLAKLQTFYVGTDDPQASLDKAVALGGTVIMPVTELPQVTIALFADPEGHVIGLASGM